jgi:hypothetical protein
VNWKIRMSTCAFDFDWLLFSKARCSFRISFKHLPFFLFLSHNLCFSLCFPSLLRLQKSSPKWLVCLCFSLFYVCMLLLNYIFFPLVCDLDPANISNCNSCSSQLSYSRLYLLQNLYWTDIVPEQWKSVKFMRLKTEEVRKMVWILCTRKSLGRTGRTVPTISWKSDCTPNELIVLKQEVRKLKLSSVYWKSD